MKKVIIFIALKIAEVSLVVFGPYYLGMWVHTWTGWFCGHEYKTPYCAPPWTIGFGVLMMAIGVVLVIGLLCALIVANWKWAGKLRDRLSN